MGRSVGFLKMMRNSGFTAAKPRRKLTVRQTNQHGQSEKETSSEDE